MYSACIDVIDADEQTELAERIRGGDPAAEARLADLFYQRIWAMMLARTRDRDIARDLAHDSFIVVINALRAGQLRNGDRLAAFVWGAARNIVNNHFRSSGRRPASEPISPDHAAEQSPDPVEERERSRQIHDAVDHLSPLDRKIILLTLVDGLKPGEIGERLGLSDEVVRARKSRALKRIVALVNDATQVSRT